MFVEGISTRESFHWLSVLTFVEGIFVYVRARFSVIVYTDVCRGHTDHQRVCVLTSAGERGYGQRFQWLCVVTFAQGIPIRARLSVIVYMDVCTGHTHANKAFCNCMDVSTGHTDTKKAFYDCLYGRMHRASVTVCMDVSTGHTDAIKAFYNCLYGRMHRAYRYD